MADANVDIYNSNGIPHSIPGGVVIFKRPNGDAVGGADAGARIIDGNFSPKKEGVLIERPGQNNGAGGFAIAGPPAKGQPAEKQSKTDIVIQYPTANAEKIDIGYYYDVAYGGETQRWVVHSAGETFSGGDYWRQNLGMIRDHFTVVDVDADKAPAA